MWSMLGGKLDLEPPPALLAPENRCPQNRSPPLMGATSTDQKVRRVVITTYLEPELVSQLSSEFPEFEWVYPIELLALPRYAGEHRRPSAISSESAAKWRELLESAEVLFDFGPAPLHRELAGSRNLRWIQATSAGVGQFVHSVGLDQPQTPLVTTARGVHGPALAEFVVMALIALNRDLPQMFRDQSARRWVRGAGCLVAGQLVCIVGLGSIGQRVAVALRPFGAHTIGIVHSKGHRTASDLGVDELYSQDELDQVLPRADVLVLSCPHTKETEGLINSRRLGLLPQSSVVINIARGMVIDEGALIRKLADGDLRGAALDVAAREPLPADSPLWTLPNVIISPHSASTVDGENQAITELFRLNLRAYLAGQPLTNLLDKQRLY